MQDFEESCDIHCNIPLPFEYPHVVYSTDSLACPTFLHMHDKHGSCMPDTISTSSLVIKHRAPATGKWEYFYLTANLRPVTAHGTADARSWRPMRLGRCVPVGMKVRYPQHFDFRSETDHHIELVHVHKRKAESQEAFDQRMSTPLQGAGTPTPMRLSTLKLLVQSVEETERATQEWRARPEMPAPFAIVRYKEALFVPTVYTFRCYEGNWSLGIPTNAGAGGAVNLTGSDMGSLVYRTRDGKALIAGQTVGMVGIVELIAPDNGDKWYVEVRHMSAVMPDLEWRFEALFPTQGSMVSARGRGR